jgi:hypothetical protein
MVNRYRRWRERSQADRGFDGEPPLHEGHFRLGMWYGDAPDRPWSPRAAQKRASAHGSGTSSTTSLIQPMAASPLM